MTHSVSSSAEMETRPSVCEAANALFLAGRYARFVGNEVEDELGSLVRQRALDRAATRAVECYGPELFGFLIHLLGSEPDAAEVFSQVTEDLWRGLPEFSAQCSVRTWLYVLARHAAARFRRSPWNRRARRQGDSRLEALIEHARTNTQPWLRTDVKDRWRTLRESLETDDRTLLVLRVDRELDWKDIARVVLGSESPDSAALARETDRLRKRFQLLKQELRRRAREAGLLEEP
jgi:RNA polymerase sigma-70 factor (ECF subfamily)